MERLIAVEVRIEQERQQPLPGQGRRLAEWILVFESPLDDRHRHP